MRYVCIYVHSFLVDWGRNCITVMRSFADYAHDLNGRIISPFATEAFEILESDANQ
jgi:hypothetical protein